jgi:hypothetical protein
MHTHDASRRMFHKLTAAAIGGIVAGAGATALGQTAKKKEEPKLKVDPALLLTEPNTCRGLNTCKGEGKGQHTCAGQGACAEVAAHSCAGENECKGQGGCGGYPGQNTCKGLGHCAVPLEESTWEIARKQFKQLMADADKKIGEAPKKK